MTFSCSYFHLPTLGWHSAAAFWLRSLPHIRMTFSCRNLGGVVLSKIKVQKHDHTAADWMVRIYPSTPQKPFCILIIYTENISIYITKYLALKGGKTKQPAQIGKLSHLVTEIWKGPFHSVFRHVKWFAWKNSLTLSSQVFYTSRFLQVRTSPRGILGSRNKKKSANYKQTAFQLNQNHPTFAKRIKSEWVTGICF